MLILWINQTGTRSSGTYTGDTPLIWLQIRENSLRIIGLVARSCYTDFSSLGVSLPVLEAHIRRYIVENLCTI